MMISPRSMAQEIEREARNWTQIVTHSRKQKGGKPVGLGVSNMTICVDIKARLRDLAFPRQRGHVPGGCCGWTIDMVGSVAIGVLSYRLRLDLDLQLQIVIRNQRWSAVQFLGSLARG